MAAIKYQPPVEPGVMPSIFRNQVIQALPHADERLPAGLYRVVWVGHNQVFLLRLPTRNSTKNEIEVVNPQLRYKLRLRKPFAFELNMLTELLDRKKCRRTDAKLSMHYGRPPEKRTPFERDQLIKHREIIRDFRHTKDLSRIFEYSQMGYLVAQTVQRLNTNLATCAKQVTRDHVYQVVYRYWMYGCNEIALIGDSSKRGAPGKFRNPGSKNRGRKPNIIHTKHVTEDKNRNVDEETRKIMWVAWEAYAGKLGKYAAVYRKMVNQCFVTEWKQDEKGDYVPGEVADNIPSLELFRYYIRRRYDPVEILRHLIPVRTWNQTKKALRGKDFEHCFGPAHKFAIDATVADVYLVSTINRHWLIGRPIVYLVRDLWSGMIVGLHVALEGPNWNTAKLALYNAFAPKGAFLRRYGFAMSDEDWPAAHGCTELYHDRGEILSIPSSDAANKLGISLVACAAFAPEQKGSIETMFHWQNNIVVHWLPGAVRSRWKERGARDCRLDAVLTLYEFTRIMIRAVLHFNAHHDVRDRLIGPLAGLAIDPKPNHLWRWGLSNVHGDPMQWSDHELIDAFLPTREASIRADGIHCGKRRYLGGSASQVLDQIKARTFGRRSAEIRYDPNTPQVLYVPSPDGIGYETVPLANPDSIPDQTRDEEWIDYQAYLELESAERQDKRNALIDRASVDILADKTIQSATRQKRQSQRPASKAEQTRHIHDNRAAEREMLYQENLADAPSADSPSPTQQAESVHSDIPSHLMSLLLANA